MATAEQIKALIRSYSTDNPEMFYTIALQVAAHEAQQGHGELAHEIRKIIDKAQHDRKPKERIFPQDLRGLVVSEEPELPISTLVIPINLRNRIERIISEYLQQHKLKTHGLFPRQKILLIGPPGTGKTLTAKVLAHELQLSLHTVQVDRLVTKFMGETSAKLRLIFDLIQREAGVYLFDEFDAIGGERSRDNDVGEMRRVLNSFLQFIEQGTSSSLIIAATNSPQLLDKALFRRFDDVMYYNLPTIEERKRLIKKVLAGFQSRNFKWKAVINESEKLSHAEIDKACRDSIKEVILSNRTSVTASILLQYLREQKRS